MLKLINAKIAARDTTKVKLQKEILMINQLITEAKEKGEFCVKININEYSLATRTLLEKAGYEVEYDFISWSAQGIAISKNEDEVVELAKEANVEIIEVQ